MSTIRDPATQLGAIVDPEGHLLTNAVAVTSGQHTNQRHNEAYAVPFAVNPDGGGDVIFYLKNLDDVDLVVEYLDYTSSAAEEIYIKIAEVGIAVATNGVALVPANVNSGSGKAANVVCFGNIGDGAVDITALTGGREIERIWIIALADNKRFSFPSGVILPKNQSFSIYCVGGDTNIRGTVHFHFHGES